MTQSHTLLLITAELHAKMIGDGGGFNVMVVELLFVLPAELTALRHWL